MSASHDQIYAAINKISAEVSALRQQASDAEKEAVQLRKEVNMLVAMANRWKGGFAVILGIGALIGWFADKIISMIHKVN